MSLIIFSLRPCCGCYLAALKQWFDCSWLKWLGLQVYTGRDSLVVYCLIADRGDLFIGSFSPWNLYSQGLFHSLLFEVPSCWVFGLLITSRVDALIALHCEHGQPSSCSSFTYLNSATLKMYSKCYNISKDGWKGKVLSRFRQCASVIQIKTTFPFCSALSILSF